MKQLVYFSNNKQTHVVGNLFLPETELSCHQHSKGCSPHTRSRRANRPRSELIKGIVKAVIYGAQMVCLSLMHTRLLP